MAHRLLDAAISVLATLVAVGLAILANWLDAFGPVSAPGRWAAEGLSYALLLVTLLLIVGAPARYFGDSWRHMVIAFVAFFAMGFAAWGAGDAVDEYAFAIRGEVTTCTITAIEKRVETSTDVNDTPTTTTYYDHRLDCPHAVRLTTMTTFSPAGKKRTEIRVRYDPTERLHPRPARNAVDVDQPVRIALWSLAVAVAARLALELFPSREVEGGLLGYAQGGERIRRGLVISGIAWTVAFLLITSVEILNDGAETLLSWVGAPEKLQSSAWVTWPMTAVLGVVLNYLLGQCRFVVFGVLRRFGAVLDPNGVLRELVAVADVGTTVTVPLFGFHVSVDTGFLGWLWRTFVGWFPRRRGRRRR